MQSIKIPLFATLEADLGRLREPERWHDEGAWRFGFLKELDLNRNILPPMVGRGSSFSYKRTLSYDSHTRRRFRMLGPRDARVAFVHKAVSQPHEICGADERTAIATLVFGELAPCPARARFNA